MSFGQSSGHGDFGHVPSTVSRTWRCRPCLGDCRSDMTFRVTAVEIVRLRDKQLPRAALVLARAFQDDPAWVWVIPDPARRAATLPWLFRVGFEVTSADVWTTKDVHGVARWLPPR